MIRILTILLALVVTCFASPTRPPAWAWSDAAILQHNATVQEQQQLLQTDSYAVQAGRFREEQQALNLASQLRKKGYQPHVLSARDSDGTVWHAVRLSLHQSLEEARAAARKFSANHDRQAMVAISGSTAPVPMATQLYFLQAGAFQEAENARQRVAELTQQGYDAGSIQLYDRNKELWHVVHAGVYESHAAAAKAAQKFQKQRGAKCYINAIDPQLFKQRLEQPK